MFDFLCAQLIGTKRVGHFDNLGDLTARLLPIAGRFVGQPLRIGRKQADALGLEGLQAFADGIAGGFNRHAGLSAELFGKGLVALRAEPVAGSGQRDNHRLDRQRAEGFCCRQIGVEIGAVALFQCGIGHDRQTGGKQARAFGHQAGHFRLHRGIGGRHDQPEGGQCGQLIKITHHWCASLWDLSSMSSMAAVAR